MPRNTRFNPFRNKKALALALVLLIAAAGGGYLIYRQHSKDKVVAPPGVNLAPATKQEKQDSEDAKKRLTDQGQQSQSDQAQTTSGKKQVSVVITHAGSDSVNAYVTGVFEEGGTCTATFTQGGTTVVRTSTAFENVSYTQCTPIKSDLPNNGDWSVVVSYSSAKAEGKSQALTF